MLPALLLSLALSSASPTLTVPTQPPQIGEFVDSVQAGYHRFLADDEPIPRSGPNVVEIALEDESFWFMAGRRFAANDGFFGVGYLGGDRDEELLNVRLLRYGTATNSPPIALGVGLGFYAAQVDNPDHESFAVALMGSIEARIENTYPVRFVFEGAYAPDVSTFGDGDRVVDLWARVEVEISTVAQAFVGYRVVQLEFDDDTDYDMGETIQIGVRLGF